MENLIESIRVAVLAEATDEQKQKGALACRTILVALEAEPGEPITGAHAAPAPLPMPDVTAFVNAVRAMGPDQLLDAAIARLCAALPAGTNVPQVGPPKFHIVPVVPLGGAT